MLEKSGFPTFALGVAIPNENGVFEVYAIPSKLMANVAVAFQKYGGGDMAALCDGLQQFFLERFAIATLTWLLLLETGAKDNVPSAADLIETANLLEYFWFGRKVNVSQLPNLQVVPLGHFFPPSAN